MVKSTHFIGQPMYGLMINRIYKHFSKEFGRKRVLMHVA